MLGWGQNSFVSALSFVTSVSLPVLSLLCLFCLSLGDLTKAIYCGENFTKIKVYVFCVNIEDFTVFQI